MAKRTVVWTQTAIKQRRIVLAYWVKRNGSTIYAEKLINLVAKQVKMISTHPESCKAANYPNTRMSILGHFSLFYQCTKDQIIITAFWDNRQDPEELLKLIQKGEKK